MLLKVGELARRAGVTVRALHHYDSIGLLRPSGRSEGGYRLYDDDDIARLHGIQALRQLGVPLAGMTPLLQGGTPALQGILARQAAALDEDIARARALRDRIHVMQLVLASGGRPPIDDWLASLSMMGTFEQYFDLDELRWALERWNACEAEWSPLVQALRQAREGGVPTDALELQPHVQQWMDLALRWIDGDVEFLARWGRMLREQPGLPVPDGLDAALLAYAADAVRHRMAVMARHLTLDEQHRLDGTLGPQWRALAARAERLMADGVPPEADAARALAHDWQALLDRLVRHDAGMRVRLLAAYAAEPLLRAGLPFSAAVRDYVRQAAARGG